MSKAELKEKDKKKTGLRISSVRLLFYSLFSKYKEIGHFHFVKSTEIDPYGCSFL